MNEYEIPTIYIDTFKDLVLEIMDIVYIPIEYAEKIVFTYSRFDGDITFSFWTFIIVTFVLDVIAFCLMGIETSNAKIDD